MICIYFRMRLLMYAARSVLNVQTFPSKSRAALIIKKIITMVMIRLITNTFIIITTSITSLTITAVVILILRALGLSLHRTARDNWAGPHEFQETFKEKTQLHSLQLLHPMPPTP